MKMLLKTLKYLGLALLLFMFFNAIKIYNYSFEYSEEKSDVAIVLGAGTHNGILSPVFKERINHAIYLYKKNLIKKIIFTGGRGADQDVSDSRIGKNYAMEQGLSSQDLQLEEYSLYTYQNLSGAKLIMDSLNFSSALIVSDPLHMRRSMELAIVATIDGKSSPTKTSMYRSTFTRLRFLVYETFFYTFGKLSLQH